MENKEDAEGDGQPWSLGHSGHGWCRQQEAVPMDLVHNQKRSSCIPALLSENQSESSSVRSLR